MLTQARLKELFVYKPDTGIFTRRVTVNNSAKAGHDAGSINCNGYLRVGIGYKSYLIHRLAWLYENGGWPKGEIDHENGIRTDNRIINLRDVTSAENSKNSGIGRRNKSGIIGVHMAKGKWCAQIRTNGAVYHLGCFEHINDAKDARRKAESKFGFSKGHGRIS